MNARILNLLLTSLLGALVLGSASVNGATILLARKVTRTKERKP